MAEIWETLDHIYYSQCTKPTVISTSMGFWQKIPTGLLMCSPQNWLPSKPSLHLWPTKVFPNVPRVSPQLRTAFLLSVQKASISILSPYHSPHFNMAPEENRKPVFYWLMLKCQHTTYLHHELPPYASFAPWGLWTCPSSSLEHLSQLVTHLMFFYAQLRKSSPPSWDPCWFIQQKSSTTNTPPNNALTFTQHPICSLQNTPHSLWKCLLDSLTFVSSTLLVERPFMVARTSPNWFAAIFSMWGKLFFFFARPDERMN